jgi:hydroxyacylglutathione hydrolase
MKVIVVPVHEDNYAYLLVEEATKQALAVDPAVPATILEAAKTAGVTITHILTTHHHWDHADGNPGMVEALKDLVVVGGDDRIPKMTKKVSHNDEFQVGTLTIKALFTPCHTSGHILYYVTDSAHPDQAPALFTGDTLFVAGCGRFFEGTGEQMNYALNEVVASLPASTQLYVGHEYTIANLKFAKHIEPHNEAVAKQLQTAETQRQASQFTVPSSIAAELTFNPFMRIHTESVRTSLGLDANASAADVMTALREAKNNYKG